LNYKGAPLRSTRTLLKKCQEEISLEDLDIPPIGVKKARGGGILIEVNCEGAEDKAEKLAGSIRKVIEEREGPRYGAP